MRQLKKNKNRQKSMKDKKNFLFLENSTGEYIYDQQSHKLSRKSTNQKGNERLGGIHLN